MSGRHALVTGATGGLGRVLVPALRDAGWMVRATGRQAQIGHSLGVEFHRADLASDDLAAMCDGVDTVFHLAALSSPWGQREAFVAANITATQRLLAAASAAQCRAFVFTSTPSIYAAPADRLRLTEDDAPARRFANAYAATKWAAEGLVRNHASSMATVTLRPRAIICPHDTVLLPRLMRAVRRGRLPLPGGGQATVELTDARDVAAAMTAAAQRAAALNGRVFNISGGVSRSYAHVTERLFERMQQPVAILPVPRRAALTLGTMAEAVCARLPGRPEPRITRYTAMTLGWSQSFDLAAARDAMGWTAQHTPEQAMDWALEGMER